MIPIRSRLGRSLSFQLVVDSEDIAEDRRLQSPIPRGDQDRPLGNRVEQVVL